MSIKETLGALRQKYGPTPTDDECAALVNAAAWAHRHEPERWGLSVKPSGAHGRLPDGTYVALDILQMGTTGEAFDCLRSAGAGGPAEPAWQPVGVITDPSRPWKAPLDPGGDPPTPPNDGDHDQLCECCECCLRIIKAELAAGNEQRQLLIDTLSRLPTTDQLRALIGELRATPLPVKMRW